MCKNQEEELLDSEKFLLKIRLRLYQYYVSSDICFLLIFLSEKRYKKVPVSGQMIFAIHFNFCSLKKKKNYILFLLFCGLENSLTSFS